MIVKNLIIFPLAAFRVFQGDVLPAAVCRRPQLALLRRLRRHAQGHDGEQGSGLNLMIHYKLIQGTFF